MPKKSWQLSWNGLEFYMTVEVDLKEKSGMEFFIGSNLTPRAFLPQAMLNRNGISDAIHFVKSLFNPQRGH
jgi:hypothetical protein